MINYYFNGKEKIYRFVYTEKVSTEKLISENDKDEGYFTDNKEEYNDNSIKWLPLTQKNVLDLVPKGDYCYTHLNGEDFKCCPFWMLLKHFPKRRNGYCSLMEVGDFMGPENNGTILLWDQTKECGINPADIRDYFRTDEDYQKYLEKVKILE
jgi:hypothetical protein